MKKLRGYNLLFIFFCVYSIQLFGQNTIGTIEIGDNVQDGYTLFAPNSSTSTYLIDNCGNLINRWESSQTPGLSAYLTPEGNLVRTRREFNNTFIVGGAGGAIEIFDWFGNQIWDYVLSDDENMLHHDISVLPNGNILAIAFEAITQSEALNYGRRLELVSPMGLWTDVILEIKPLPNFQHEIVWKWRAIDHIVQNENQALSNFGNISDFPERLDVNVHFNSLSPSTLQDWMHCNAIDYNAELDQILLNSRNFNEFFIIDHSTTTEEAASSEGGRYGKGGDLLYRWGNPAAYDAGLESDQKFFGQHDAHWIPSGNPDGGKIMVFNNGLNRPDGAGSVVEIINPPIQADGSYALEGVSYGPAEAEWSYGLDPGDENITSIRISGAGRQPNGNTLITIGSEGRMLEIDENENVVWQYTLPLIGSMPNTQGNNPAVNTVFRSYKYPLDYPAFTNNEVIVGDPIELEPNNNFCLLLPVQDTEPIEQPVKLLGNLVESELRIYSSQEVSISIFDINGIIHYTFPLSIGEHKLRVDDLPQGMYFVRQLNNDSPIFVNEKFIKIN